MRRIILGLALAAASAGSAYATPVAGTFGLAGDMLLSSDSISWASPGKVPDEAVVDAPTTGSFTGLDGSVITIDSWSASTEPVDSGTFSPQAFVSFPAASSLPGLLLNFVVPGIYSAAGCSATPPAAGQICTAPGSMLDFANIPGGSSLTFALQGVTSDGHGTWNGIFSAQFNTPYQDLLADMGKGSAVSTSYSAEFTITPTKTSSVPEPATLSLFAAGLAAAGAAIRRRRRAS
jgi:hypothetical protein